MWRNYLGRSTKKFVLFLPAGFNYLHFIASFARLGGDNNNKYFQ